MVNLHKIRVNDIEPIVRAVYAEETNEFLFKLHHEGNGLDACVAKTVENVSDSRFFRIENEFGALVGFFSVADDGNGNQFMPTFHVRPGPFRTPEYLAAFWQLVKTTFNNQLYTSVGVDNYKALNHLLKNDFEVVNNIEYEGKDFKILRSPIN